MNVIEGNYIGRGLKIAIVVSRFNEFITKKLLEGAIDALTRHDSIFCTTCGYKR